MTPTVIVTRPLGPYAGAHRLVSRIRHAALECIHLPVLAIDPITPDDALTTSLSHMMKGDVEWLVLLSPVAVHVTTEILSRSFPGEEVPSRVLVAVQGSGTNEALIECLHRHADLVPQVSIAEELAREIVQYEAARGAPQCRVLILQAKEGRDVVAPYLREHGKEVVTHPIYETVPREISREHIALVSSLSAPTRKFLFMSPSAVRATIAQLGAHCGDLLESDAICVGPITARAAREGGFSNVVEADDHSEAGLVSLLISRLESLR
jgi:uroporphyrinogen-III synthase